MCGLLNESKFCWTNLLFLLIRFCFVFYFNLKMNVFKNTKVQMKIQRNNPPRLTVTIYWFSSNVTLECMLIFPGWLVPLLPESGWQEPVVIGYARDYHLMTIVHMAFHLKWNLTIVTQRDCIHVFFFILFFILSA